MDPPGGLQSAAISPVQPEVQATPGSEVQAAPVAGSGVGLMEKYKNLQQGTMRQ